jgi:hypothetical protein
MWWACEFQASIRTAASFSEQYTMKFSAFHDLQASTCNIRRNLSRSWTNIKNSTGCWRFILRPRTKPRRLLTQACGSAVDMRCRNHDTVQQRLTLFTVRRDLFSPAGCSHNARRLLQVRKIDAILGRALSTEICQLNVYRNRVFPYEADEAE